MADGDAFRRLGSADDKTIIEGIGAVFEGIIVGVISTFVGGLILAGIIALIRFRRSSNVRASYVVATLPLLPMDFEHRQLVERLTVGVPALEPWKRIFDQLSYSRSILLVSITIHNPWRVRSGHVEIAWDAALFWHCLEDYRLAARPNKLELGTVDPRKAVTATAFVHPGINPSGFEVLEAGQRINAYPSNVELYPDAFLLARFVLRHPNSAPALIWLLAGLLASISLLISTIR
jgi:hypothetical protein